MAAKPKQTNILYSDFGVNLQVHPITGDLLMFTNEDAVKRSVINLLLTKQYERYFNTQTGAGLAGYLFELPTLETADLIADAIKRCIQNHEKRANLISVDVQIMNDDNAYQATVTFSTINRLEPIVFKQLLYVVRG